MSKLASVVPNLAAEIEIALASDGYEILSTQLASATIERCSYDSSSDAGYIYLSCPKPSLHFSKLAAKVAKTIPFLNFGFNIDVSHDGDLFGIELMGHREVFKQLGVLYAL